MKRLMFAALAVAMLGEAAQAQAHLHLRLSVEPYCSVDGLHGGRLDNQIIIVTRCNTRNFLLETSARDESLAIDRIFSADARIVRVDRGEAQIQLDRGGQQTFVIDLAEAVDPADFLHVAVTPL